MYIHIRIDRYRYIRRCLFASLPGWCRDTRRKLKGRCEKEEEEKCLLWVLLLLLLFVPGDLPPTGRKLRQSIQVETGAQLAVETKSVSPTSIDLTDLDSSHAGHHSEETRRQRGYRLLYQR